MKRHRVAVELKFVLVFSVVLTILACPSHPCCAQDPRREPIDVRARSVRPMEGREMFVQQMAPQQQIHEAAIKAFAVQEDVRLDVEQRVQRFETEDPGSAEMVREIVGELSKERVRPEELERLKEKAARLPTPPEVKESLDTAFRIADMKVSVDSLQSVGEQLIQRGDQLTKQRAGFAGGLVVSLLTYVMTLSGFLSKHFHSKLEIELLQLQIKEKRADLKSKGVDLSG